MRMQLAPEERSGKPFRRSSPPSRYEKISKREEVAFVGLVALICVAGTTYQIVIGLQNFFAYPSIVSSTYEDDSAEFPGVTICPENWYNMSQVCQYWPKNCTRKDVVSIIARPILRIFQLMECLSFLTSSSTLYHQLIIYSMPKASFMNEFREYGQPTLNRFFRCEMVSRDHTCPSFSCTDL